MDKALSIALLWALAINLHAQRILAPIFQSAPSAVTLYYGLGCNGTSTNTCYAGTSGQTQSSLSGYSVGYTITTGSNSAGYSVKAVGAYFYTAAGNIHAAIYSGPAGSATRLCQDSAQVAEGSSQTWTENTNFSGCTLAAGTTYYALVQQSSNTSAITFNGSGVLTGGVFVTSTYGTFPASGVNLDTNSNNYSVYVRVITN